MDMSELTDDQRVVLVEYRLQQVETHAQDCMGHGPRIAKLEAAIETLAELKNRMDSINGWLKGVAGSLLVALVLLVIQLLSKGNAQVSH